MQRHSPISTVFPYTTLFRSVENLPLHGPEYGDSGRAGDFDGRRDSDDGVGVAPAYDRHRRNHGVRQSPLPDQNRDRKSTRLNSSHTVISYAVFCLKKKTMRKKADQKADLLSHGEKQWLEIGMLLMQDPRLLLLDEPVAGMSDDDKARTGELLRSLA